MNERIKELVKNAGLNIDGYGDPIWGSLIGDEKTEFLEKFAELIVAKVLDEVADIAYYSGDRAWSDELDRQWVELEFGIGKLAGLKE